MASSGFAPPSPQAVPSATVKFLFTDIEGSSRLWAATLERMGAALGRP